MAVHKWAKEIKAWADGAEIEGRNCYENGKGDWHTLYDPTFSAKDVEYRIKPTPKEPQYLDVSVFENEVRINADKLFSAGILGKFKIKLDVDDAV